MNFDQWKTQVQAKLRGVASTLQAITPGALYGALATTTILPLVAAANQGQAPYGELITLLSSAGVNLLVNQLQLWKDRTDQEIEQDLVAKSAADPAWVIVLDTLLEKFDALRVVQAVLSEADKDELTQRFLQNLRQELAQLGSRLVIEATIGDHNEMVAVGTHITQTKEVHYHYAEADKTAELRQRYLRRLLSTCSSLPLAMLGSDEEAGAKVTLDAVYIDLDTQSYEEIPKAEQKKSDDRVQLSLPSLNDRAEQRQLSALEVATRHPHLVLLGDPGSGKSTFVQKMAAWVAAAALGDKQPPEGWVADLLPIFTVLRDLAPKLAKLPLAGLREDERDKQLVQALLAHWQAELDNDNCGGFGEAFQEWLAAGRVFLVFDGLDEVPQQTRLLVRQTVAALLAKYAPIQRVIITCRIRSYTGSARLPGWPDYRLAPFDSEQVQRFVAAWYNTQYQIGQIRSEKERGEQIADLQQAVRGDALAELAANPMLLTTMALIHQREVRLPNQRVKLYKLAVENLLQRWQRRKFKVSERLEQVLSDDRRLRKIVERIAYEALRVRNTAASDRGRTAAQRNRTSDDEESGDLRRGELLELLEDPLYLPENGLPDEFLDYIDQRAGLLLGKGGSDENTSEQTRERKPLSYRFPHRTFQEYLAGCYLVSLPDVADEYWQRAAQGDGWDLAAQLGGEELYFNSSSGANTLLQTLYHLCPAKAPRSKEDWRRLLWSAQLATLFQRVEIERHRRGSEQGSIYLKRLIERLVHTTENRSKLSLIDRASAANALARLGDPRPGVGVKLHPNPSTWARGQLFAHPYLV